LPPHTTHRMQPLDRTFYGPLKAHYNTECDKWMTIRVAQAYMWKNKSCKHGAPQGCPCSIW